MSLHCPSPCDSHCTVRHHVTCHFTVHHRVTCHFTVHHHVTCHFTVHHHVTCHFATQACVWSTASYSHHSTSVLRISDVDARRGIILCHSSPFHSQATTLDNRRTNATSEYSSCFALRKAHTVCSSSIALHVA